jgi:hypothetical protein
MSTPKLPLPGDEKKKPTISWQRIALWVLVAGAGLYLVITGLAGVIAKG